MKLYEKCGLILFMTCYIYVAVQEPTDFIFPTILTIGGLIMFLFGGGEDA